MPDLVDNNASKRYFFSSKNWWKFDPKNYVLKDIMPGETVLDVGCAYGDFGSLLRQKGCKVDGIDNYPAALEEAKSKLDSVIQLDLNNTDEIRTKVKSKYDVITFMDVLEHCNDPLMVLTEFKSRLSAKGRIYVSLPNIANLLNRIGLLFGHFNYSDYGVLDKTHLRFFTRKTALELVGSIFENTDIIAYTPIKDKLRLGLKICPSLFALHFIIKGSDNH